MKFSAWTPGSGNPASGCASRKLRRPCHHWTCGNSESTILLFPSPPAHSPSPPARSQPGRLWCHSGADGVFGMDRQVSCPAVWITAISFSEFTTMARRFSSTHGYCSGKCTRTRRTHNTRGLRLRTMYLATVDSATSRPSKASSDWMRVAHLQHEFGAKVHQRRGALMAIHPPLLALRVTEVVCPDRQVTRAVADPKDARVGRTDPADRRDSGLLPESGSTSGASV